MSISLCPQVKNRINAHGKGARGSLLVQMNWHGITANTQDTNRLDADNVIAPSQDQITLRFIWSVIKHQLVNIKLVRYRIMGHIGNGGRQKPRRQQCYIKKCLNSDWKFYAVIEDVNRSFIFIIPVNISIS